MSTRASRIVVVLVVASTTVIALADAPVDQYDVFDKSSQKIKDFKTDLTWQRYAAGPMSFGSAKTYCSSLLLLDAGTDGGLGGWRTPTYKELLTLVDETPHMEWDQGSSSEKLHYIDRNAFPATPVDLQFYSQSTIGGSTMVIDFSTGNANPTTSNPSVYVRCVR